jgi:2-polyprenyl-3-methyl-5-hydroxy-6-metoxy-1,4-benzoquinol methylase
MRVLDVGCGMAKAPGTVGLDVNPRSSADVIHDLNRFPYPFAENEFDEILCKDVLEHVEDFVRTVEELYRICKPGGKLIVSAPFMSSVNFFSDPTHKRAFTSQSFDYFIEGTSAAKYNYSAVRLRLLSVEYDKGERALRPMFHRWLLDWANRNKLRYEQRYAFVYPLYQIHFELEVVKHEG